MADTYGVAPKEIAAELPFVFKSGDVTQADTPDRDTVVGWISTADTMAYLVIGDVSGAAPQVSDKAASLAKDFIRRWVKWRILQAIYAGNDPDRLAALGTEPNLDALKSLGAQLAGTGEPSPTVGVNPTAAQRGLLVTDANLDAGCCSGSADPGTEQCSTWRGRW